MFNINKIKKSYFDLLYQYNEKYIDSETIIWQSDFVNVSRYFSDIPQTLTKYVTREILKAFKNRQAIIKLPISFIVKFLDRYTIKDFRGFHSYLDKLLKNDGQLTIQLIGQQNCYYQPPELFNIDKIRIFQQDKDPFKLVILSTTYQNYVKQKLKQVKEFNDILKIISQNTIFNLCFKKTIKNHKYLQIITNSTWFRYFSDFINIIFNDSKTEFKLGRNNFKIFKKWLIHSFEHEFNVKLNFNYLNFQ